MTVGAAAARTLRIGGELEVAQLGYGAMRLTGQRGNWSPCSDAAQGIRVRASILRGGVERAPLRRPG